MGGSLCVACRTPVAPQLGDLFGVLGHAQLQRLDLHAHGKVGGPYGHGEGEKKEPYLHQIAGVPRKPGGPEGVEVFVFWVVVPVHAGFPFAAAFRRP